MYDILIGNFIDVRGSLHGKFNCDSVRKIINISEHDDIETVSKNSDIICYYDMGTELNELMILVERVPKKDVRFKKLASLRSIRRSIPNCYYVNYNKSNDGKYVDFTIMSESLKRVVSK